MRRTLTLAGIVSRSRATAARFVAPQVSAYWWREGEREGKERPYLAGLVRARAIIETAVLIVRRKTIGWLLFGNVLKRTVAVVEGEWTAAL